MRAADLALYADMLAGEAAALSARAEQARARLYQSAIERRARAELDPGTVKRLEALGLLGSLDESSLRETLRRLTADLRAVEELQVWVETKLAAAGNGLLSD